MATPRQGDVFWASTANKRRPVLVTRSSAVEHLDAVVVAPITRTIRDIATEVPIPKQFGHHQESVASFDNLEVIRTTWLTEKVGSWSTAQAAICRALAALANC